MQRGENDSVPDWAGGGGGQGGGEGRGGRRVVEVVGEPMNKRRSIIATVPAHGDLSPRAVPRARAFILLVRGPYYECNGRGYACASCRRAHMRR